MKRTVPGLLLAAGWLLLILQGSFLLFWAMVVLIVFIGSREYSRMAYPHLLNETDRIVLSGAFCLPIFSVVFVHTGLPVAALGLLLGFCVLLGFVMYHYDRFENPFILLNRGLFGIFFIGFTASHLVLLRDMPYGTHWLVILSGITAGSDTCAYLVGCKWGRRKLCPAISPKKTVEGALGGLVGALLLTVLLAMIFPVPLGFGSLLLFAFFLTIAGIIGDLLESIVKRGTATKDSGTILLGHGGVLDRVDSLLFTAPICYYTLLLAGF